MEKYIVYKEIGSGSFGKVFVVESKSTGIQYVAKQIDLSKLNKRQKTLAEKEIHVLSKLKHSNIVRYKEAYSDEKNLHIVMELCELGDLHSLIQETRVRNERLSDQEVMSYFVQICLGIEYIHQQRILHRDLKTKNIFLKKGNVVKLGDFGVAKMLENSFELARTCIGSPFYISPEMCENLPYDKKSDIWALGCVLFELATLRYAFTAKNMKTLLQKITTGEHTTLPPNINPKIRFLIKKLLHQNPKQRPTASEILSSPHVVEFKEKVICSYRRTPHSIRSKSKEELRIKIDFQNNFRWRNTRTALPISKSSLNLNFSDITEPQAKYKAVKSTLRKPNFWKTLYEQKPGAVNVLDSKPRDGNKKEIKNNSKEAVKTKRLPKADSLYYSLIEENNKNGEKLRKTSIIRNMLEKGYKLLGNQEEGYDIKKDDQNTMKKNFDDSSEKSKSEKVEESNDSKGFNKGISKEDGQLFDTDSNKNELEETKQRKRWNTSTADKNQLISLLHETDLVNTFPENLDTVIKGAMYRQEQASIDDLLFAETSDLSHITVLEPQKISEKPRCSEREQIILNESINQNDPIITTAYEGKELRDETYIIHPKAIQQRTAFEELEQRRIHLEQKLGLIRFLQVYKIIEDRLARGDDELLQLAEPEKEVPLVLRMIAQEVNVEEKEVQQVWDLVSDDSVYKQY